MRYATVGTGWIVDSFIRGAGQAGGLRLEAVYSRDRARGEAFALGHGGAAVFTDLEALAAYDGIDGVYIASPNALHAPRARLFLEHGKHVLCEKPLAVTAGQVRELTALAREKGVLYLEAIMLLYQPALERLRAALTQIGNITAARFDFSQLSSKYPAYQRGETPNIFNPALAAGCLMDLGVYCVYPALELFGRPREIHTSAGFLTTGADGYFDSLFLYGDKQVHLSGSKVGQGLLGSEILGDRGTIAIGMISQLTNIRLAAGGREEILAGEEPKEVLMGREAATFARYAAAPERYAVEIRHAQELAAAVAETMELMRRQAGIRFQEDG